MELSLQFLEVDEDKLGYRRHDTPAFLTSVPVPNLSSAHWEARRLQGSTGNWGSRSFVSPGRFSGLLSVSLSSLSLSQGLLSAKATRPLMAGSWLGLRLLALQLWGPLSKQALGNRAAVPEEGAGWERHTPPTLDPGGAPV